jgi:enoyl-CoA hydratase
MELIEYVLHDRVGEIVFNRPDKLNAIHAPMLVEFKAAIERARDDAAVSVVLLRGNGRAFTVGWDLVEVGDRGLTHTQISDHRRLIDSTKLMLDIWDFPKPIVSAVHGFCFAAGAFIASMTDVIVASDNLEVGWAKVPLGAGWMTQIFTHLIGASRAMELSSVRGSVMTGEQALQWGWATHAYPADEVLDQARELAGKMARTPVDLLVLNKRAARKAMDRLGFRDAITGGIEYNNLAHFTPGAEAVRAKLRELGVGGVIEWFEAGGTLRDDFPGNSAPSEASGANNVTAEASS